MTTTDSEMMEDPVRPVIDDELVDRPDGSGRRGGFGAFGPGGGADRADVSDSVSGPGGGDG